MTDNNKTGAYDTFPLGSAACAAISMDTRKTQCNNNILVVGGSGSGKTVGVAYPMLLHLRHGNAVGVFTKRGMTDAIRKLLKNQGYHVYEIDFCHPNRSPYGYDPLMHCFDDVDISFLAKSIINAGYLKQSTDDPFWNDSAESILRPVLRYVWKNHYAKGRKLYNALDLLDSITATDPDTWEGLLETAVKESQLASEESSESSEEEGWRPSVKDYLQCQDPDKSQLMLRELLSLMQKDPIGKNAWESFARGADSTRKSIMMCLMTPLEQLFTRDIRLFLKNPKEFSFERLLEPKTVLFVYTSPVNPAFNRFVSIFYQQLFKSLFEMAEEREDGVLPSPVYVLCDDFATGAPIQNFPELISIFRAKRISTTMLIQSETQLASIYGSNDAKTIINNCDTYIYMGGMDIDTCHSISQRMDWPYTDVLNMPVGRELFFRRGQRPVAMRRYDLFHDPLYKACQSNAPVRQ